jgi:hypothetical protein
MKEVHAKISSFSYLNKNLMMTILIMYFLFFAGSAWSGIGSVTSTGVEDDVAWQFQAAVASFSASRSSFRFLSFLICVLCDTPAVELWL